MNKTTTEQPKRYRNSAQRAKILSYLQSSKEHPSALAIYQALKPVIPSLSLGNLYRNLHILVDQGLVLKLSQPGAEEDRFDGFAQNHMHLTCIGCGELFDLPLPEIGSIAETVRGKGFELIDVSVQVKGLCPACRKARGN